MKDKRETLDKENKKIKLNKIVKKQKLQDRGITLIALVVTIIILLILAGVTLNIALSDNGLFSKTKEAAEKYKEAQREEEKKITEVEKQFRPVVTTVTELAEENIEAKDSLGNLITIPKGFKIVEGSTVKDGIVIEDEDENQFVWIPVSNVDGDNDANTESNSGDLISIEGEKKVEITLGRYTFDWKDGTPVLVQKGSEYSQDKDTFIINECKENTNDKRTDGCEEAKSLKDFVESVKKNHGYYLARYEARQENDEKPKSKPGIKVWNNITQSRASIVAQQMYEENENYTSDLVNSYAWDTAIVYIQAMGNEKYSIKTDENTDGEIKIEDSGDEKCNIYDMAGNVNEWTTEYCTSIEDDGNHNCVDRGGCYCNLSLNTVGRYGCKTDLSLDAIGFRAILYLQ